MRSSAANKTEDDMVQVAHGFGFEIWNGKKHTTARHKKYPHLICQWPRHKDVDKVYVKTLISLIDEINVLEGKKDV